MIRLRVAVSYPYPFLLEGGLIYRDAKPNLAVRTRVLASVSDD